jgi:hypothetical protein
MRYDSYQERYQFLSQVIQEAADLRQKIVQEWNNECYSFANALVSYCEDALNRQGFVVHRVLGSAGADFIRLTRSSTIYEISGEVVDCAVFKDLNQMVPCLVITRCDDLGGEVIFRSTSLSDLTTDHFLSLLS